MWNSFQCLGFCLLAMFAKCQEETCIHHDDTVQEKKSNLGDVSSCSDTHENCEYWASLQPSECDVNPKYMNMYCRKSCRVCNSEDDQVEPGSGKEFPSIDENLEFDMGVHQRIAGDVANEVRAVVEQSIQYMRNVVLVDPKYGKVRMDCKNHHAHCAFWAFSGECTNSQEYMDHNCAPSCQSCDKMLYEFRCPMHPLGPDALGPGDLNLMFERITTALEFQKYNPRILSQPAKRKPTTQAMSSQDDINDSPSGPWVVHLDEFVSPDECDRLVQLGHSVGFQRSADVGDLQPDGRYRKHVNQGRTSSSAWCKDACFQDVIAKNVMARISNLTGIPETNSELLQLLKYEQGEFYKSHHDCIPFEADRQPGVRVLTVFLYLNHVEKGGGTNFPNLGLTVEPKRGAALVWANVCNDDPNKPDQRTLHEALPVENGIKYGANVWTHQRDYKGPYSNKCN